MTYLKRCDVTMFGMSRFEQLGIGPHGGKTSLQQGERGYLPVQDFFDESLDLLPDAAEVVQGEVIPNLEQYDGRWHPSGYAVYRLGQHAVLGSLRLHVWPEDLRHREDREGPLRDVHDHVVHIASTVMEGTYIDNIYRVEDRGVNFSDEEVAIGGLLRVFTPPSDKSGSEVMTTDGRVVQATEIGQRIVPKGDTHTIEVGIFHAPAIPEDGMAATLSFSSPRAALVGPHILMGGSTEPIKGKKRPVTEEEADIIKQQLLE